LGANQQYDDGNNTSAQSGVGLILSMEKNTPHSVTIWALGPMMTSKWMFLCEVHRNAKSIDMEAKCEFRSPAVQSPDGT